MASLVSFSRFVKTDIPAQKVVGGKGYSQRPTVKRVMVRGEVYPLYYLGV